MKRGIENISGGANQPNEGAKPQRKKKFKLSEFFDKLTFKAQTHMPLAEKIDLLWQLNPSLGKSINQCVQMIYSHITQRSPQEGYERFFHATAATALYEAHYQTLIHGKNHAIKAGGLYGNIQNTLSSIERALSPRNISNISENQRQILLDFKAMLIVHKNALKTAIDAQPTATKEHLETHYGLGKLSEPSLSLSSEARAQTMFPVTPPRTTNRTTIFSETTAPSTPKYLSKSDKASIFAVNTNYSPNTRLARQEARERILKSRRSLNFDRPPQPVPQAKPIIHNEQRKLFMPRSVRMKVQKDMPVTSKPTDKNQPKI